MIAGSVAFNSLENLVLKCLLSVIKWLFSFEFSREFGGKVPPVICHHDDTGHSPAPHILAYLRRQEGNGWGVGLVYLKL